MNVHDCPKFKIPCGDAIGLESAVTGTRPPLDIQLSCYEREAECTGGRYRIPITATFPIHDLSPAALYQHLRGPQGFLLESMEGVPRRAVRSIIGTKITETLILDDSGEGMNPIDQLRRTMAAYQLKGRAPAGFAGGLVGYCPYDMVSSLNRGYLDAGREEGTPIGKFMVAETGIVLDHQKGTCTIFCTPCIGPGEDARMIYEQAEREISAMYAEILRVKEKLPEKNGRTFSGEEIQVSSTMNKEQFEEAVRKTLDHIRAGDIFQAVISQRFRTPYTQDPFRIYREVRELNPSPYLYYIEFGDETIIGSSPEMLVKSDGEDIFTVPIAGTRPRGRNPEEDERLAVEMLADEKERAEHLMLVDLARNDIGKVASFGTVQVTSFMEVEKFSHVQHITSVVTGKIREHKDRFDALGSCFPAGTVSGAPKLRAMQIIAELEPCPRGVYAGAVGNIGFDDRLEFAIAIRTVIVKDGIASFQTGAGIVADSDPTREFEETRQKAGAMLSALTRAQAEEESPACGENTGGNP